MRFLKALGITLLVLGVSYLFGCFGAGAYKLALHFDSDPREAIFAPYIAFGIVGLLFVTFASLKVNSTQKPAERKPNDQQG